MEHKCDDKCLIVNSDSTLVCKLSGECYHQFISANSFRVEPMQMILPRVKPETRQVKKTRPRPVTNDTQLREKIVNIIHNLLYSPVRQTLSSKQVPPTPVSKRHHKKRRTIQDNLERNPQIVDQVANETLTILKMVLSQRPFIKHKSIVLASIYLQQHGKEFETKSGQIFRIRECQYLYKHLPSIGDLKLFGFAKNMIRIGTNIIQEVARDI